MTEREHLEAAIAALEAQRAVLGDAVVDASLGAIRQQLAALAPPAPEQRKQVTVLFADVSSFTALAEQMDPEEVRDLMNALWSRLDAAIAAHGGTVDKHMGDAVMALFGTPAAQENDPERAVRAALDIQAALQAFAEQTPDRPPLQMRIGINTGPVLLGAVGSGGEYTALGTTVNVASRLEHAAPPGGELIGHATYRQVRGLFDVAAPPPLTVKGKAEPLQTYLVQRARPRTFRAPGRGVEGVATPMVGRAAELQQLEAAFATALAEHTTRVVTIVGEAGLGKSRLLGEFVAWLELRPAPVTVFQGRADARLTGQPYGLLRDLLAARCAIRDSDPAPVARAKLEAGLGEFLGGARPAAAHVLGQLIGLDFAASAHLTGLLDDPRQLRTQAFQAAVQFFAAVAQTGPVVLLLEDIHWADEGSLDLLEQLSRELPAAPLLILSLARPTLFERRPNWGAGAPAAHTRMELQPLAPRESRRLVGAILRRLPAVPAALTDLVVGGAAGNPFYVEELIQMLIDEGVIRTGGAVWAVEAGRLAPARVPATLMGVLQARLDGLPGAERAVLQRAAVVGPVFWEAAVAHLAGGPGNGEPAAEPGAVGAALASLRGKELVY